jgi:hypothetical protein
MHLKDVFFQNFIKSFLVGPDVNIDDITMDINDATGVLKLYFRELPEKLFTNELYARFIEAAGKLLRQ